MALGAALAMEELYPLPVGRAAPITPEEALERLSAAPPAAEQHTAERYFATDAERQEWQASHTLPELAAPQVKAGDTLRVYIGVDAGSTTGKLVLLDENEQVVDRFYANNRGDPIEVIRHGLQQLHRKYALQGVTLEGVLGPGAPPATARVMLSKAFGGDYHTVETVAHAAAACHYVPDVTFLLDIGGQDMKAIWIQDGVVTNMLLNEACFLGVRLLSGGVRRLPGAFPVDGIADAAFRASTPAELGSRCTVFMNSSIITEQKNAPHPRRHYGGAVPLDHQKCFHQGGAHPPTPTCWAAASWCRAAPLKTTRCCGPWSSIWAAPSPGPPIPARWAPSAPPC